MADWNVDLTATLASADGGNYGGVQDTATPPDSSSPSEAGDGELGFLQQMCKTDVPLAPISNNAFLMEVGGGGDKAFDTESGLATKPQQWASVSSDEPKTPATVASKAKGGKNAEDLIPGPRSVSTITPPKAVVSTPVIQNERKRKFVAQVKAEPSHAGDRGHMARNNRAATLAAQKDREESGDLLARDPSTLSPEELKLLKKQRRLVKNRESAQLSRQRKKSHMETLEAQVQQLEMERVALAARMEQLSDENKTLKKKLGSLGGKPAAAPAGHMG
eukprot:CAMPEP_0177747772 /NCGR_PEP_ID=MMETSP0484_2-20121128/31577_1 /TAXON_ID=354590 /ORGANISM="Rhodomonas lens, Strain RHODO" /LENGTH=275 /DNA_ID=CAMNT_0019262603 /DNA_START=74 /DNA_END=897 /DNA_ORIENTATION=+